MCACLVDGVDRHKSAQLGVETQVPYYLREGAEATKSLEVRQCDGHLGLVIVVGVDVGSLGVEPLRQLFVWVRLHVINSTNTLFLIGRSRQTEGTVKRAGGNKILESQHTRPWSC